MQLTVFLITTLLPSLIASSPISISGPSSLAHLLSRTSCTDRCGSVCYYASDVSEALNQGYSDYKNGNSPGGYPHQYNDYEGFSFPDAAPYYEFPILKTYKVYTGGSPGPDRVVFDENGDLQALITHTGASGDDFVECS